MLRGLGLFSVFFVLFLSFQNCAEKTEIIQVQATAQSQNYFSPITTKVVIDAFYEAGAEPFVGQTSRGVPVWNILLENLNSIFQFRGQVPTIVVPTQLSQMTQIPTQNKADWLGTDLIALQSAYGKPSQAAGEVRFSIFFLKGYFNSGSGPVTSTIGVSLGGTTVIGLFKQVVQSTGYNSNGPVPKFVEQSTLVHELGHALGLVNNGVPMVNNHEDAAHPRHSNDPNCVMYYLNEGLSDMTQFIQKYATSNSYVMWGPDVLADVKAFSR